MDPGGKLRDPKKGAERGEEMSGGTPLKFNMESENGGLEDNFPFQLGDS